jgi:hypothetical protein
VGPFIIPGASLTASLKKLPTYAEYSFQWLPVNFHLDATEPAMVTPPKDYCLRIICHVSVPTVSRHVATPWAKNWIFRTRVLATPVTCSSRFSIMFQSVFLLYLRTKVHQSFKLEYTKCV